MKARRALVVAAVMFQLGGATAALALFTRMTPAVHTLATNTLGPLTNLAVSTACNGLLSLSAKANLSWTATPSTFASGYKIERWKGAVLQTTITVDPRSATAYTDNPPLSGSTNYTWKVHAYMTNTSWTSPVVSVSATTPLCL